MRVYWGFGDDGAVLDQQVHDQATDKRVTFNCTDLVQKFLGLRKSQGNLHLHYNYQYYKIRNVKNFLENLVDRSGMELNKIIE